MGEPRKFPQYIAGLSASGGALACGVLLGWSAPVQNEMENTEALGFSVTADEFSWIGSLVTLGAAASCIPTGILIGILGRRRTMLMMVIPFCIAWAMLIFAVNAPMIMAARFLLGLAGGSFCVAAPIYTTEIAQKEIRGILGSFFQMLLCTGVLFSYILGAFVNALILSIVCAAIPIVFVVIFFFMPDSPHFLVSKGKLEAAKVSMQWLRGKHYDPTAELDEMKANDQKIKDNHIPLTQAFTRRITLKALGLGVSLQVLQQFSGINAIIFYSTDVFHSAGSSISASLCTIIVGVMLVSATFASLFVIDILGRIPLLMISTAFQAVSTLALGVFFFMQDNDPDSVSSIRWIPMASICIFILMFSFGMGPVPWLYNAEIFSDDVKGYASSIAATTNWLGAFVVTKSFLIIRRQIGAGASFWIFTVICIVGGIFILFCVPETKGKTTAEIQDILEGKK